MVHETECILLTTLEKNPRRQIMRLGYLLKNVSKNEDKYPFLFKGDTGKQALKLICQRSFNFRPIILKFSANASFLKLFELCNQI